MWMHKDLFNYLTACLVRALRGSLSSALNWTGVIGVGLSEPISTGGEPR